MVYLTERVSSSANIEFHARILIQKYIQRRLIKMSNEIIEEAYDEETDVFDLLDSAEGKLFLSLREILLVLQSLPRNWSLRHVRK